MKGLLTFILENKQFGNCSNNGVSARYKAVTLVGDGVGGHVEPDTTAPAVVLLSKARGEDAYLYAVPADLLNDEQKALQAVMFGGSFIWSCDARFPSRYPIPLHDRVEGWSEHDLLSAD